MISFTVMGTPIGKARARTVMQNGFSHSYTPRKTVEFEQAVAQTYKNVCRGAQMPENAPLKMRAICYMPIPKSTPKRLRELMASERVYHTKKPDASNILKSIEDAIVGMAYKDDSQIADTRAIKYYSENPRVEVSIETL